MKKATLLSSISISCFLFFVLVTISSATNQTPSSTVEDFYIYLPVVIKPSSPQYKIAFASDYQNIGGIYDIYLMNTDGTGLINLTNTPNNSEISPKWSPDGTMIAYISVGSYSDPGEIFTMNADGSNKINVSNAPEHNDVEIAWSPNSQQVAFASDRDNTAEIYDIYVVNKDGVGLSNLTNSSDRSERIPQWSPNGDQLVFASDRMLEPYIVQNSISTINSDGTNKLDVYSDGYGQNYWPQWFPDNSKISFIQKPDHPGCLVTVNPNGDYDPCFVDFIGFDDVSTADWNSDGSQLLIFGYLPNDASPRLYVRDLATQQMKYIGYNPNRTEYDWSWDDSQIVFSGGSLLKDIFVVSVDTSSSVNITENLTCSGRPYCQNKYPNWSPVPIP